MQIIRNWLNSSQNFTVGKLLYNSIGTNQALKDLLTRGETAFAKKLLVNEFEKILNPVVQQTTDNGQQATGNRQPATVNEPPITEGSIMPDSDNDVLKSLKQQWLVPYQKMNYLRHQLDKEFDDNDSEEAVHYRRVRAFEILELEQQCMQVWKQREYFIKNGKLANVPDTVKMAVPSEPLALASWISNCKKNIRRNRKLMADNPQIALYASLYLDYKAKYKEVTGKDYEEKL